MVNVAWTIWRCRNEKAYGGKVPSFQRFKQLLKMVDMETHIAASAKAKTGVQVIVEAAHVGSSMPRFRCNVDGSWKPPWMDWAL